MPSAVRTGPRRRQARDRTDQAGRTVRRFRLHHDLQLLQPSQIVIGDIVAEAGQLLLDEVHKVIDKHVIHELNDTTAITLSALPADAALNGAAAVAINQFLDHPSQFFELS